MRREHGSFGVIRLEVNKKIFDLFVFFCMCPFLFPLPFLPTNLQPYACVVGTLILVLCAQEAANLIVRKSMFMLSFLCCFAAAFVLVIGKVNVQTLRGFFNHASVFVIPLATYLMMRHSDCFPERNIKLIILFWFFVSSVQFFVDRGFFTRFIGAVRWSYGLRGVVGLASEPSFLGIACFYFLFLVRRFRSGRLLYSLLITLMGTIYAQSFMGIVFIAVFYFLYWLDNVASVKGIILLLALTVAMLIGWEILCRTGTETRLFRLLQGMMQDGVRDTVLADASASARYHALIGAVTEAFSGWLLPQGFSHRIGSGYGGIIIEMGVFGLVECILLSAGLARGFETTRARVAAFALVTALLFLNTQVGNPLLLMIVGIHEWENGVTYGKERNCE